MAGKTFEVNFKIAGELSKSLSAALKAAQQQMSALANTKIKGGAFDGALKVAAQQANALAAASKAAEIANAAGVDKLTRNIERLQQLSANVERLKQLPRELDNLSQAAASNWREAAKRQAPYEAQLRAVEQQRERLQGNQQAQVQQKQTIAEKQAAWKQAAADRNAIKVDITDLSGRIKAAAKDSPERAALAAERERLRGIYDGEAKERIELARADFREAKAALAQMKADAEAINRQLQSASQKLEPKQRMYEGALNRAIKADEQARAKGTEISNLRGTITAAGFDLNKMAESEAKLKASLLAAEAAIQQRLKSAEAAAAAGQNITAGLAKQITTAAKVQQRLDRQAGWMSRREKLPAVKAIDAKDERGRTEQALSRVKDYREIASAQLRTRQEAQATHGMVVSLGRTYTQQKTTAAELGKQLETLRSVYREHGAKLPEGQAQEMARQIQQLSSAFETAQQSLKSTLTSLNAAKTQWRSLNETSKSQGLTVEKQSAALRTAGVEVPARITNEFQIRAAVEATTRALEQRLAVYQRLNEAQARLSASANEVKRQAKERTAETRAKVEELKTQQAPAQTFKPLELQPLTAPKTRATAPPVTPPVNPQPIDPLLARITSAWQNVATHQRLAAAGSTFVTGYNLSVKLTEHFDAVQKLQQKLDRQVAWLKRQGKMPKVKAIDAKDEKARLEQTLGRLNEYRELIKLQTRTRQEMQATHGAVVKLGRSYVQQKAAAAELKTQIESLKAVQRDHSQNLTASQNRNLARQIQQLSEAHAKAEQSIKSTWKSLSSAKGQWGNLNSAFKSQSAAAQELSGVLKAAGANVMSFAAAEAKLKSELNSVTRALESQAAAAKRQEHLDNVGQKFSNAYNDFQNIVSTAQTVMAPFSGSVDVAASFEKQMSTVKALTQMDNLRRGNLEQSEKEMRALTEQSKHLGLTTQFTAIEAAKGQTYLAYAGMTTPQILDLMPTVLNVAAASGMTDLGRVADIFTDIGMAFKIPADQMRHVGDVLTYTFTHSNQNFEQLAETMKYAAPIARLFGSSIEETAAITKFMADSGIKGSMAGTATRSIMTRLVAPPKAASAAMQENGISLSDANKEWLNANEIANNFGVTLKEGLSPGQQMASIIRQINDKMGNLSSHEKLGIFKAVTGMYALSGAANLFETGGELIDDEYNPGKKITRLEAFTRDLENSGGSADQTAKIMLDNYAGQVTLLKSAIEGLQVEVGAALTPTLRAVVETVTPLVTKFAEFNQEHPQIVQGAAAIATGLTAVAAGAAGLSLAFAGWNFVSANLAALGEKVAAFGARIAGLSISPALTNAGLAFVALKSKAGAALEFVITKAGALVTFLRGLTFASIAAGANSLGAAMLGLAKSFAAAMRAGLMFAFSPIGVAAMALGLTALAVYKNWDKVAPVFEHLAGVVSGSLTSAFNAVSPSITNAVAALDRLFETMGQGSTADVLAKAFVGAVNIIIGALTTMVDFAANAFAALVDIVGGAADVLSHIADGDFKGAFDAASKHAAYFAEHTENALLAVPRGLEQTADSIEKSFAIYDKGEENRRIREQQKTFAKLAEQNNLVRQKWFAEHDIDPDKYREQIALTRKAEQAGFYSAYRTDDGVERHRVTNKDIERYQRWKAEYDEQGRAERIAKVRAVNAETLQRAEEIGIAPSKKYDQDLQEWVYSIPLTVEQQKALKGLRETGQKRIAHNLDIDTSGWEGELTKEQRAQLQAAYKKQRASIEAAAQAPSVPQGLPEPEAVRNAAIPNAGETARIAETARFEARSEVRQAQLERAIEQTQNLPSTPPNYLQPSTAQTYLPGETARLEALKAPAAEPAAATKPAVEVNLPSPESVKNAAIPTAAEMGRKTAEARRAARTEYQQAQLEQNRESTTPPVQPKTPRLNPPSYQTLPQAQPLPRMQAQPPVQAPTLNEAATSVKDAFVPPVEKIAPRAEQPAEPSSTSSQALNSVLSSGLNTMMAAFAPLSPLALARVLATPEQAHTPRTIPTVPDYRQWQGEAPEIYRAKLQQAVESNAPRTIPTVPDYRQWQGEAPEIYQAKLQQAVEAGVAQAMPTGETTRRHALTGTELAALQWEQHFNPRQLQAAISEPAPVQLTENKPSTADIAAEVAKTAAITTGLGLVGGPIGAGLYTGYSLVSDEPDAFKRLSGLWEALQNQLPSPFSTASAATPESVGAPSTQLETAQVQAQLNELGTAAGTNAQSFTAANQQFSTLTATTEQVQAPLAAIMNSTEAFGQQLQAMTQSTSTVGDNLTQVETATATTAESMQAVTAPVQETANQLEQTSSTVQNVNETFSQVTQAIGESVSMFNESLNAVGTSLTESFTAINTATTGFSESLTTAVSSLTESFTAVSTSATENFAQIGAALTVTTTEVQQLTSSVTANNAALQQSTASLMANISTVQQSAAAFAGNAASAQTASASLQALSGAAQGATGSVAGLGGASSNAAGSVSALGAAAANAVASMQSAAASISAAAASVGRPAQNYKGGIYHQGAFLTWFAERSPEAAIPLDGSDRAIGLWQQAGSMLGVYPYENQAASYSAAPKLKPAENYAGGIYARGGKDITLSEAQQRVLARRAAVVQAYQDKAPVTSVKTDGDKITEKRSGVVRLSEEELKAATNVPQVEVPEAAVTIPSTPAPKAVEAVTKVPAKETAKAQTLSAQAAPAERRAAIVQIYREEAERQGLLNSGEPVKPESFTAENQARLKELGAWGEVTRSAERLEQSAESLKSVEKDTRAESQSFERATQATTSVTPKPEVVEAAAKVPAQVVAQEPKKSGGKNFFEKGAEAVNEFFFKVFHPRKYAAKQRGYETDKLGNIIGLDGLPDNVITENDTPSVQADKRKAQIAEFEKKRAAAGTAAEATKEGGQSRRNLLADWNIFATGTSNLGGVLRNVFGGDPRSNQRAEFGNLLGGGSPWIDAGLSLLSGGGLMGAINAYFTPKNVKAQSGAQAALDKARVAKLSDKVKGSKSYEVLTGARSRGTGGALTMARQSDGQNVIRSIKSGDWKGALGGLGAMYSRSLEIGGLQGTGTTGGGSNTGGEKTPRMNLPVPIMHMNAATPAPAMQTATAIQNEAVETVTAAEPAAKILTATNAEAAAPAAAIMSRVATTGGESDGLPRVMSAPAAQASAKKQGQDLARIKIAQQYLPGGSGHVSEEQMRAAGLSETQQQNLARIEAAQQYLPGGSGHVSEEQMRAAGLSETQQQNLNRLELAQQYLPRPQTTQENFVTQWQAGNGGAQLAQLEYLEARNQPAGLNSLEGGGGTESGEISMAPINLTFTITIQGNADRNEVQAGVQQSIPLIRESFEDQLRKFQHERRRRAMTW